jgi:hypothetical protein
MDGIVQAKNGASPTHLPNHFEPPASRLSNYLPLEDAHLYSQQRELSTILETASDYKQAQTRLAASSLAHSAWDVERWEPAMLETAVAIAQKWQRGFTATAR